MTIARAAQPGPTTYTVDGVELPRVTHILKVMAQPRLDRWRGWLGNDEADRQAREGAAWGTQLHHLIEQVNRGASHLTVSLSAEFNPYLDAYVAWYREHVRGVMAYERQVVSRDHGYAGTLDCLVEDRQQGRVCLLDYKSARRVPAQPWPAWRLQLAAYRLALAEEGLIARRRIVLVFVRSEPGRLVPMELDNHRADTEAWLHCLALWKWRGGNDA